MKSDMKLVCEKCGKELEVDKEKSIGQYIKLSVNVVGK